MTNLALGEFMSYIQKGSVPPLPPDGTSRYGFNLNHLGDIGFYEARRECNLRGMWAIVDKRWTHILADWIGNRKCLEVMAGGGWLAGALSDFGIAIIATDDHSWLKNHTKMMPVFPVQHLDAIGSVRLYSDSDILIVSWPPYGDETICDVCREWGSERPIVYIGEGDGGCNAPECFWNQFERMDDFPDIPLMCWDGIHDSVFSGFWMPSPRAVDEDD